MVVFPAIDIKDGNCVRLQKGDFERVTVYSDDPVDQAKKWRDAGCGYIHVVDLDGAKDGDEANEKTIRKIASQAGLKIQVGGGIRSVERAKDLLEAGVSRIIVGTMAIEDRDSLKELVAEYGQRICVSIDAKKGKVATRGWVKDSGVDALELAKELESIGIGTIVYTDIEKDGMLEGPNFEEYRRLSQETGLDLIASGGISSIEDIRRLKKMGIYGAIVGKAIYDGKIKIGEVRKCLQEG